MYVGPENVRRQRSGKVRFHPFMPLRLERLVKAKPRARGAFDMDYFMSLCAFCGLLMLYSCVCSDVVRALRFLFMACINERFPYKTKKSERQTIHRRHRTTLIMCVYVHWCSVCAKSRHSALFFLGARKILIVQIMCVVW